MKGRNPANTDEDPLNYLAQACDALGLPQDPEQWSLEEIEKKKPKPGGKEAEGSSFDKREAFYVIKLLCAEQIGESILQKNNNNYEISNKDPLFKSVLAVQEEWTEIGKQACQKKEKLKRKKAVQSKQAETCLNEQMQLENQVKAYSSQIANLEQQLPNLEQKVSSSDDNQWKEFIRQYDAIRANGKSNFLNKKNRRTQKAAFFLVVQNPDLASLVGKDEAPHVKELWDNIVASTDKKKQRAEENRKKWILDIARIQSSINHHNNEITKKAKEYEQIHEKIIALDKRLADDTDARFQQNVDQRVKEIAPKLRKEQERVNLIHQALCAGCRVNAGTKDAENLKAKAKEIAARHTETNELHRGNTEFVKEVYLAVFSSRLGVSKFMGTWFFRTASLEAALRVKDSVELTQLLKERAAPEYKDTTMGKILQILPLDPNAQNEPQPGMNDGKTVTNETTPFVPKKGM